MPLYTGSNSRSFKLMNENLISPGILMPGLTLTRAQAGGARSTALNADGLTWSEFGADVPRFNGTARRLMIGGQRTNSARNPRAEGAAAGTPGISPTHWGLTAGASGITREIVGVGVESGIPGLYFRLFGTASAAYVFEITPEANFVNIPASIGQTWTTSVFARLTAGSLTNFGSITFEHLERGGPALGLDTSAPVTSSLSRFTNTYTNTNAATTGLTVRVNIRVPSGATVDGTFFVGGFQVEQGAFASSPILPPVGTPGASTRGADLISASLASLGIGANGACTILGTAMLPQNAPSSADQMLVQIDSGTDTNRYLIRNVSGGGTIVAGDVNASSATDATSAGSMTAGSLFRFGISINGSGGISSCLNEGSVRAAIGGPTSGLTTLRVGNNAANTTPLNGEVGSIQIFPFAVPDAQLQSMVASFY